MMEEESIELGQRVEDTVTGIRGNVTKLADHISDCRTAQIEWQDGNGKLNTAVRGVPRLRVVNEGISSDIDHDGSETILAKDIKLGDEVRDQVSGYEGIVQIVALHAFEAPKVYAQSIDPDDTETTGSGEWLHAVDCEVIESNAIYELDDSDDDGDELESKAGSIVPEEDSRVGSNL